MNHLHHSQTTTNEKILDKDYFTSSKPKMWRLKIGEGASNPYLYSTNNFVGRQTWEFDSDYGTPEEIAEVEQARLRFWNNRHKIKPNGDLIWRLQVCSVRQFIINALQYKQATEEKNKKRKKFKIK